MEAKACVKKYLTLDSLDFLLLLFSMSGINLKVFSSKATHLNNKEGEEVVIRILLKRHIKNNTMEGLKNIEKIKLLMIIASLVKLTFLFT